MPTPRSAYTRRWGCTPEHRALEKVALPHGPGWPERGAVERVRPKMMTVTAIMAGLIPILWSQGTGADVMKRIAAPMVGGMLTSTILTLVVIPAIYSLWKERTLGQYDAGGGHGD